MHAASGGTAAIEACCLLVLTGADQRHLITGPTVLELGNGDSACAIGEARNVQATSNAP